MTDQKPSTFELRQAGQSPWLDYISRQILSNGKLQSLINDEGLLGVTSNPSIFEKSISDPQGGYEKDIQKLIRRKASTFEIYDQLTIADIRRTCDLFLPVFKQSGGEHGFVSLEVMPGLAHDAEATHLEALRLFKAVSKPNVMIKVPATLEGIPIVRRLIGSGININITLMFSLKHYQDVAHAYLAGLGDYQKKGGDLSKVHSVASVFVSRVDTLVDKRIQALIQKENRPDKKAVLEQLLGKAACANAKIIYQEFRKILSSKEFLALKNQGANVQKVLWGSTSSKNPSYPDLLYVENLIGEETVNTMPLATLEAFLDHGKVPGPTLLEGLEEAEQTIRQLDQRGMNLIEIGEQLQKEGVQAFVDSFDSLMRTIEKIRWKTSAGNQKAFSPIKTTLSNSKEIQAKTVELARQNLTRRFFQKDPSIWKMDLSEQKNVLNRLGWLDAIEWMLGKLYELDLLREKIVKEKIQDIVLLGMGGSSLAPEVLSLVFKKHRLRIPKFHVLDTTDSASIQRVAKQINLAKSLFIVASKSGTTVETVSQYSYFYDKVYQLAKRGAKNLARVEEEAGRHFIAITDGGSWLEQMARDKKFRSVFINPADIGGRFSALSYFGMVPAALLGLPVREILRSANALLTAAKNETDLQKNPAVFLGVLLAQLAKEGKDKLTVWTSPRLESFACWVEQLVAESTGKEGQGVVPIEGEPPLDVAAYGADRVFMSLKLRAEKSNVFTSPLKAVKKAGYPVIEIDWPEEAAIGAEFLRWEIATTIAGAVLEINPFDEPNVTESKDNTARLLDSLKTNKKLSFPSRALRLKLGVPISIMYSTVYPQNQIKHGTKSKIDATSFLAQVPKGGYIAFLAYLDRSPEVSKVLKLIRTKIARRLKVPVLVGYGPRYLHSIGQLYKGGPRKGVFIELVSTPTPDLKVPGAPYTFNQLKRAQALGDRQALQSKGLPVLTCDIMGNPVKALHALAESLGG